MNLKLVRQDRDKECDPLNFVKKHYHYLINSTENYNLWKKKIII